MRYSFNFPFNDTLSVPVIHAATPVQLELQVCFNVPFLALGSVAVNILLFTNEC